MEIKKMYSDETYISRTVCYQLLVKGEEIEIAKRWFYDGTGALEENEWDGIEDSDKKFIEELEDEEKDELDDFICELT